MVAVLGPAVERLKLGSVGACVEAPGRRRKRGSW